MPAPVVLFAFNRPEHTRRTVEALAGNQLAARSELWVFCDGPKDGGSASGVAAVRQYIRTVAESECFRSLHLTERDMNLGLARSVIMGVSEVISARSRAIVLEDDLVTAPDFLGFVNGALERYERDNRIGSVTGYSPLKALPSSYREDAYFLPRTCSFGWGTWRDRWEQVDWEVHDFDRFRRNRKAQREFNRCGSDATDMLIRQKELDIDSWSIRFGYWQFRSRLLTVYPAVSRIKPIGWDGSGVHSGGNHAPFNSAIRESPTPFSFPDPFLNRRIIRQAHRLYSGPMLTRCARWLRLHGLGDIASFSKKVLGAIRLS